MGNVRHIRVAHAGAGASGERGFAIIVVLLVIIMLILLGVSFLLMADIENRIAKSERLSSQALYAAETGTRQVKRWFDRPMASDNLANPPLAIIDRTQRMIDADGDPATPPVMADGTPGLPYYKQGVDGNGDGEDDVFRKPYRGSLVDTLLGTESGPDMRIDETASAATKTFLDDLSEKLFGDYPRRALRAQITRIDVYAPPTYQTGGTWVRYGMATVKVIARIYRRLPGGSETALGERMVKVVLNEIPYNPGDLGPLHSCDLLTWNGEFTVYWGIATAVNDANLHSNHDKAAVSFPRLLPPSIGTDRLWGYDDPAAFGAYKTIIDGLIIQDPWLRIMTGGALVEPVPDPPSAAAQPFPFTWAPGNALASGDLPYHPGGHGPAWDPYKDEEPPWDGTHSNMFQFTPPGCPDFPYQLWKSIAQSGGSNVHYYAWSPVDGAYREDGIGPPGSLRDFTDQRTGLFFFDSRDNSEPRDDDADGEYDNLAPEIRMSGGRWGTRGMVYLNVDSFYTRGIRGREVTFNAPGEPFLDLDSDGRWDTTEDWVNIAYPTSLGGLFFADAADDLQNDGTTGSGIAVRNNRGPSFTDDALLWGVLYNNGYYDATGNGVFYGTLVSKQGIGEEGPSGGTPEHYWDESLRTSWPPDDWDLPRVAITRWETDM